MTIALDERAFARWDAAKHTWHIDKGTYGILVGSSSKDIRARGNLTWGARMLKP